MRKLLLSLLLVTSITYSLVGALTLPDKPAQRVNDYSGTIDPASITQIESLLTRYEQDSTNQIAIAVFNSLDNESLEDISIRLADKWKIGQKGKNNGVILLIFLKERKLRIEVGYGLEADLTDAMSNVIINQEIVPYFKQGQYGDGLLSGTTAIIQTLSPKYQISTTSEPAPTRTYKHQGTQITPQQASSIFMTILLLIVSLLITDMIRYNRYKNNQDHYQYSALEWWASFAITFIILKIILQILLSSGSRRGGDSFGSGGGISFGGGGGSFGGGGSSGRW